MVCGGDEHSLQISAPQLLQFWCNEFWKFGGKGWLNEWNNKIINDIGVCRTAPAKPKPYLPLFYIFFLIKVTNMVLFIFTLFKKVALTPLCQFFIKLKSVYTSVCLAYNSHRVTVSSSQCNGRRCLCEILSRFVRASVKGWIRRPSR